MNPRYEKALGVLAKNPEAWPVQFRVCMANNPAIWAAFVDNAFKVIRRGFKHYSSMTIIHAIRHHSALSEDGSAWKLNNNHAPYFSRLFDAVFPANAGLWEMRSTQKERAA